MADFRLENGLVAQGYSTIAGVDEVGRGCLFGPVVAAAVVLPNILYRAHPGTWVSELDDSKKLSSSKRERLAREILDQAQSIGIGMASNEEIDTINIRLASFAAMRRAIQQLSVDVDFLLIDGFRLDDVEYPQMGVTKGDSLSSSIAAASIVAKVFRDMMMIQLDRIFTGYGIAQHKGYGTKMHREVLKKLGPTPFHRLSFCLSKSPEE